MLSESKNKIKLTLMIKSKLDESCHCYSSISASSCSTISSSAENGNIIKKSNNVYP